MDKKKTTIPWDNHIMKKFGGNIRKEIAGIAVADAIRRKNYELVTKINHGAVWGTLKPGRC